VTYAQTHLQLLGQLRDGGYDGDDLVVVKRAYTYACELFTGAYRGSGKPFVCHLVGTASVLASLELPATIVVAGLLHAAYQVGDFGAGWLGRSDDKREQVRRRVGDEIEALIHRYTLHPWETDTPADLAHRLTKGDAVDRDVILIRLANEVDDHLDLGVQYCRNAAERLIRLRRVQGDMIVLARELDQPRLGQALEAVFEQCLTVQLAEPLRTPHSLTFVVPTISRARWRWRRVLAIATRVWR
jgi:(p)ppGpp synthase/HD superfamily hydrolase